MRVLAGFGVLILFGATFALPLYAALSLCTMPCCHHGNGKVVRADMSGCAPHCVIVNDEATAANARVIASERSASSTIAPSTAAVAVIADVRARTPIERDAGWLPRAAGAPVHVLNSVFRI
jgi:hypothetical protein